MKKQTAVEWLANKVIDIWEIEDEVEPLIIIPLESFKKYVSDAKAMEQHQIEHVYVEGIEKTKAWAKQYYNDTYGGDE